MPKPHYLATLQHPAQGSERFIVVLVDLHPALLIAAYPDIFERTPWLIEWSALPADEAAPLAAAYAELGRDEDVVTPVSLLAALRKRVSDPKGELGTVGISFEAKIKAVEAYAAEAGIDLA